MMLPATGTFAAMNSIRDNWIIPGHTPPRATLLCGMLNPDWKLEILVTAAV